MCMRLLILDLYLKHSWWQQLGRLILLQYNNKGSDYKITNRGTPNTKIPPFVSDVMEFFWSVQKCTLLVKQNCGVIIALKIIKKNVSVFISDREVIMIIKPKKDSVTKSLSVSSYMSLGELTYPYRIHILQHEKTFLPTKRKTLLLIILIYISDHLVKIILNNL